MKATCLGDLIAGVQKDFNVSEIVLANGETIESSVSEATRIIEYYRGFVGDYARCFVRDLEKYTCADAKTYKLVSQISRSEKPGKMSLSARISLNKEISRVATRRYPKPGYQYDCFA